MSGKKIRFNWNFPLNGNICPLLRGGNLLSPVFYLNEAKRPGYCFKVRLRLTQLVIRKIDLLFCRIGEDGDINAEIDCDVSTCGWDEGLDFKYQFPEDPNTFNSCDKGSFTVKFVKRGETSFDLICTFEPVSENEDLEDLSRCFALLLEERIFPDYTIYSATGKKHLAHRAILDVRSPEFVRETTANSDSEERMSDKTIQILLHYLYSGKLNTYNIPEELDALVKKLGLLPFHRLLSKFPNEISVKTVVKNHIFDFSWEVGEFGLNRKGTYYYTVTVGKPFTWLKVILSIKKKNENMRQELKIHRICNQKKIFILCKINANMADGRICDMGQHQHFFKNNRDWILTLPQQNNSSHPRPKKNPQSDILKLNFEISISKGSYSTRIMNIGMSNDSDFVSKANLYELWKDLERLYENLKHHDIELKAQDGTVWAHKAIVSARSEVFNAMFRNNFIEGQLGKVHIVDIEASTLQSMLSYMYSIQTEPLNYTKACSLYYAADKYQILLLKKKCSKLLMSYLDFNNIEEILKLAFMHSDQELEQFVIEFPCRNPREALNSETLNDFMKKTPEFSFEVFRAGLKMLAKGIGELNASE